MKNVLTWTCAVILLFTACSKVPLTNRLQFNMLPESTMMSMSLTNYKAFLAQHPPLPVTDANTQLVQKVGKNMAAAVEKLLKEKGKSSRTKDFKWEFNLVKEDKTVNAWCMPGGKVVVYTGLLPVTQTEAGLAVVMGHEIAHAIARHGNERMSQALIIQLGGIGLATAMSTKPTETQNIFLQSYNIGSTLGALAYSRNHESEADKLGLVFMAIAGYDPSEAVAFWERMAKSGGGGGLQLLSTHPSNETRIKDIKAYLPTAMKYYKKP